MALAAGLLGMSGLASAQSAVTVTPFEPVTGEVTDANPLAYTFSGISGQVISVSVTADDGFDPVVALRDSSGTRLIGDDDALGESRDALLQAITLPRTDTYTLEVSGYGDSVGGFTLLLTTGFAEIAQISPLDDVAAWRPLDTASTTAESVDSGIRVGFDGQAAAGTLLSSAGAFQDFAVRAQVSAVTGTSWVAGLAGRENGGSLYAYQVNSEGRWRFVFIDGDSTEVLSDWRSHPAIRPGETRFSLMLMARAGGFDFFYDDAFVGSLADTNRIRAGRIGLLAGTTSSVTAQVGVTFESVQVTAPVTAGDAVVIPNELIVGDGVSMAQALVRRHVAGADGELTLTVPTATVNFARGGINTFLLGQRRSFGDFALGATVTISNPRNDPNGCGMVFRYTDEANYVAAFLDAQGGYGASEQVAGQFVPGLFDQQERLAGGGQHHLLVIASGNRLFYYIDGISAGSMDLEAQAGQVGAAVVNYAASETNCTFTNVWLWEWPAAQTP
jgi:hypothetical protein